MSRHEMTTASMITCASCKHSYADTALFCPNCGTAKARDGVTSDSLLGKLLGERFIIHDLIGQGASGTIYRGEHVTLRRKVAVKVLHNELSRDDLAVERFRREATTVAEIDNEHIVEIHDFGRTPDGRLYLAMELLEGETLDTVLAREHQLSVERTADILIQVGEALMEAHAIGYVHRDLRPRNVYLAVRRGKANFVKLLDFGLSKLVETDAQAASTSLGMTFGDPRYMSPEQARGDRIDRRADIYQLGCVAYEMLTGSPPFVGNRVFDILSKQVTEIPAPVPTRRPGVPLWMEAAITKMLAKDPENRFATTTRMVEALRRGLETGEVMEDEIARRRESIPPPSVSRVMQKMGLPAPIDAPAASQLTGKETLKGHLEGPLPPLSQPVTGKQTMKGHLEGPLPVVAGEPIPVESRKRTGTPQVGVPIMPAPATGSAPNATQVGSAPGSAPIGAPGSSPHSAPHGVSSPGSMPLTSTQVGSPPGAHLAPAAAASPPIAPSHSPVIAPVPAHVVSPVAAAPVVVAPVAAAPVVAPVAAAPVAASTSPVTSELHVAVAGQIDPPRAKTPSGPVPASPAGRAKRPSASGAGPADSSSWFDEGESASEEADRIRARKTQSPSSTDLSLYDEPIQRRRWPIVLATLVGLGLIGGTIAFALTRGDDSKPATAQNTPPTPPAPMPAPPTDVPESQIIGATDTGSATPLAPTPTPTPTVKDIKPTAPTKDATAKRPTGSTGGGGGGKTAPKVNLGSDDAASRRPTGGGFFPSPTTEPTPTPTNPTPTNPTPTNPTPTNPTPTGVSGSDGPVDPYGSSPSDPPADGASADKKAEFFANVGQQQLASGDTAGAAASFKKALELDPKNVPSVIGMGEIALRQGLFGDAIAHLKKAVRLAPKSSRVFTLLGEAYLNSGNNAAAIDNFKKALQLDPDNARARDGFNEASSKAAPEGE